MIIFKKSSPRQEQIFTQYHPGRNSISSIEDDFMI